MPALRAQKRAFDKLEDELSKMVREAQGRRARARGVRRPCRGGPRRPEQDADDDALPDAPHPDGRPERQAQTAVRAERERNAAARATASNNSSISPTGDRIMKMQSRRVVAAGGAALVRRRRVRAAVRPRPQTRTRWCARRWPATRPASTPSRTGRRHGHCSRHGPGRPADARDSADRRRRARAARRTSTSRSSGSTRSASICRSPASEHVPAGRHLDDRAARQLPAAPRPAEGRPARLDRHDDLQRRRRAERAVVRRQLRADVEQQQAGLVEHVRQLQPDVHDAV